MTEATLFLRGLSPVGGKEIPATFDGGQLSSDGGVLILRKVEERLGIATMLSRHCFLGAHPQSGEITERSAEDGGLQAAITSLTTQPSGPIHSKRG